MSVVGPIANNPDTKRRILRTQIFWQLTRQSLPMRPTPWRRIAGSAPQSLSLDYFTAQSIKRLYMLHSSSEAQLEHSGLPTSPPYLMITMFHGVNSVLLCNKLNEFLDLEQGNHSVFDYMRQFNTLAQYGAYGIDTDEKKSNMYHAGLTIHM
jgi:hypothetical protein